MKVVVTALTLAAALLVHPATASATIIEYEVFPEGGSVWRYDYYLSGGTFTAGSGFTIYFAVDAYAGLLLPAVLPPDWDILTTDPDPSVIDSRGIYDALARVDAPAFAGPFSVSFTWLMPPAMPGAQDFEIYSLDASGSPVVSESGRTRLRGAAVPEPATFWLLAAGAAAGWARRRPRRTTSSR
jgi:hypothetical protein